MKHIFGPVPSRRLGRSLGIDVIPPKTCSYDCVYCESGRTDHLTIKRKDFVLPDKVLEDLDEYFGIYPQGADVLTFSSAGEPTLYEPLGDLLRAIKKKYRSLPLVVLTNGSLLWDEGVRRDLMAADRVVPSLDAASRDVFQALNRPHPGLDLSAIVSGLEAFSKEYRGQFHLEIMLVSGYNDRVAELSEIGRLADRLHPERIELNTVARPPVDPGVEAVGPCQMESALKYFPAGRAEIIGCFQSSAGCGKDENLASRLIELVRRRPCTLSETAASLGVPEKDLKEVLDRLEGEKRLIRSSFGRKEYLCPHPDRRGE